MTKFEAVEVTAEQAFFLADILNAGALPWKLAITTPYYELADRDSFNDRCRRELSTATEIQGRSRPPVIDSSGQVRPSVANAVRAVCRSAQRLEWLTIVDKNQILRSVLARTASSTEVVCAQRYAQMVTFTPMEVTYTEALVPIVTAGLQDLQPARFREFSLSLRDAKSIDERVRKGADIIDALTDLGVPASDAAVMELAYSGAHPYIELTAHDAINGARRDTEVSINVFNSSVGRIVVSTPPGEQECIFAPGDPFAIAVAIRDLTDRLPSGTWFPDDNLSN